MKHPTAIFGILLGVGIAAIPPADAQGADELDANAFIAVARHAVRDSAFSKAGRVLIDPRPMLVEDPNSPSSVRIDLRDNLNVRSHALTVEHIDTGDVSWPENCAGVMTPYSAEGAHKGCPHATTTVIAMTRPLPVSSGNDARSVWLVYGVATASAPVGVSRLVLEYKLQAGDTAWRVLSKRIVAFSE